MKKLSVSADLSVRENYMITLAHKAKLINVSIATGKTKSELIREGIDMLAEKYQASK